MKIAAVAIWCGHDVSAAIAEDDRREITGSGKVARKRQRGVVGRPTCARCSRPYDTLARQLVRPSAGFASWLVGAVEIAQQMELRRVVQDGLIEIDDLFRFVIEEVDLHAGDAEIVQPLKERARSNFAILNVAAVDPQQ